MDKKNILTYITIAGLSVAFILISALVFITRGKNPNFLKKKLRLGGMILALTSIMVTNSCIIGCYVPPTNELILDNENFVLGTFYVNFNSTKKIMGNLYSSFYDEKIPYNIEDDENNVIQSGYIKAVDRIIDTSPELVYIQLDENLPYDNYHLNLNTDSSIYVYTTVEEVDYSGADIYFVYITDHNELFNISNYITDEKELTIDLTSYQPDGKILIEGFIALSMSEDYSIRITDSNLNVLQKTSVHTSNYYDGINNNSKSLSFNINADLTEGTYNIEIYNSKIYNQDHY